MNHWEKLRMGIKEKRSILIKTHNLEKPFISPKVKQNDEFETQF